ncbi:MAG: RiPP maturation radical SAM protein 1, partial [Anaerolinea sp.]|nr:RiPP maturation radical SAM protein 1 [Anaerolinea sp.]
MRHEAITKSLTHADVLIIVPPFAGMDRASLGVHTLQAVAKEQGYTVDVFYANLLFADRIGAKLYQQISYAPTGYLFGERVFAEAAYRHGKDQFSESFRKKISTEYDIERLIEITAGAAEWVEEVADALAAMNYKIVGATSTFEQTAASLAFLNAIKRRQPDVVTIIGGANCEGPMADGIAALAPNVDYIFSGESESTFIDFLNAFHHRELPATRIFYGEPNQAMQALPCPDYTQFYAQFDQFIDKTSPEVQDVRIWLVYESSRGCWWGQKHHCTFCGLNGSGMVFRQKSADRILADLKKLAAVHPTKYISMVDQIMPNNYFKTLLPRLGEELPGYMIFYEQKANLDFHKVQLLANGGIMMIQPGIEALSTPLLRLMDKGVSGSQNLALLRYARITGIQAQWNLLCGFPGDQRAWYELTYEIIKRITHLQPPSGIYPLSIDRFSPYYERAADYGISALTPFESYFDALPDGVPVDLIAYHFTGTFASDTYAYPDFMYVIQEYIKDWRRIWETDITKVAVLSVAKLKGDLYVLKDTRGLPGTKEYQFITREQALVALTGLPASRRESHADLWDWALANEVGMVMDERLTPLATADAALLIEMEEEVGILRQPSGLIMPS